MLLLQALSCLFFGVALINGQVTCNGPSVTFLSSVTKTAQSCTEDAGGDAACEASYPGYLCTSQTSVGQPFCCGMQAECDAGFIAHFDRTNPDFFTSCVMDADCQTAGLGPTYVCQGTAPDMFCCTRQQPPPANCNPAISVDVKGVCQPLVAVGGACVADIQCPPASGATCSPITNNCDCPPGLPYLVNGVCIATSTLGGPCQTTVQCSGADPLSTCNLNTGICECAANNIQVPGPACQACPPTTPMVINNKCYASRTLGQSCPGGAAQCPPGAVCSFTCICPTGTLPVGVTQCIRCDANVQVLVNGVCYNKATFGAACSVPQQCSYLSGVCSGTCGCDVGNVWDGSACQPCTGANKALANNVCYDMSSYGASCNVAEQCASYSNGVCNAGQCLCAVGTAWNGANCAACGADQILAQNQCLNKATGGASCVANEQCSYPSGICTNQVCGCTGTLVYKDGQCVCDGIMQNGLCYQYAAKGQTCISDAQCTKNAGTKCLNFVCDCPAGTTFSSGSCVPIGTQTSTVTCGSTQTNINDICYPLLNPNGYYCYYPQQCIGGSTCTNYVCQCPSNLPAVVNNVCSTATVSCTGNTVLVKGACVPKTTDGVCLNVNCLSTGNAGCVSYAPYSTCAFNAGNNSYFCCQ